MLRVTARISVALFLVGFAAPAWARLVPNAAEPAARLARAGLVGLAISHTVHLAAIFTLWATRGYPPPKLLALNLIFGGAAYAFIYLVAADAVWRRMPPRLVSFGSYWIWAIFTLAIGSHAAVSPLHAVTAAVLVLALVARIAAVVRRRPAGTG